MTRQGDPDDDLTSTIVLIEELGIYHLLCALQSLFSSRNLEWETHITQAEMPPYCRSLRERAPIDNRNYLIFYSLRNVLQELIPSLEYLQELEEWTLWTQYTQNILSRPFKQCLPSIIANISYRYIQYICIYKIYATKWGIFVGTLWFTLSWISKCVFNLAAHEAYKHLEFFIQRPQFGIGNVVSSCGWSAHTCGPKRSLDCSIKSTANANIIDLLC